MSLFLVGYHNLSDSRKSYVGVELFNHVLNQWYEKRTTSKPTWNTLASVLLYRNYTKVVQEIDDKCKMIIYF